MLYTYMWKKEHLNDIFLMFIHPVGFTVNVNSEDAFHTWNSDLLNYANSCHFPRHMVEILKYSVEHKCPLSVQVIST